MESRASSTVTLAPRSARSEANSHPMAPPPDDGHRRGHLFEVQELVGGHHPTTVDLEPGQGPGHRPRRQDDVRPISTRPASSPSTTRTRRSGSSVPVPERIGDLATLQQPRQALEQLVDHAVLPVLADRELQRAARATWTPKSRGRTDGAVHGGGLEELLGRDAAPMQAGAADLVPLDDGHREPGCGSVERRGVPAGPATNDDDVELVLCAHRRPFSLSTNRVRPVPPLAAPSAPCLLEPSMPHPRGGRDQTTVHVPPATPVSRERALHLQTAFAHAPGRPPWWRARRPGRSSGRPSDP